MTGADIVASLRGYGVPERDAGILAAVAYGESSYNPKAYGDRNLGGSVGLFQIHLPSHSDKLIRWTGSTNRQNWITWLENPGNNIFAASEVYKSQGLGAWTVYNTGAYKNYLDKIGDLAAELSGLQGMALFKEKVIDERVEGVKFTGTKVIIVIVIILLVFYSITQILGKDGK